MPRLRTLSGGCSACRGPQWAVGGRKMSLRPENNNLQKAKARPGP